MLTPVVVAEKKVYRSFDADLLDAVGECIIPDSFVESHCRYQGCRTTRSGVGCLHDAADWGSRPPESRGLDAANLRTSLDGFSNSKSVGEVPDTNE